MSTKGNPVAELSYRFEDGAWIASCAQVPGLSCGNTDLIEAKMLAGLAAKAALGDSVSIVHWHPATREAA